MEKYIEHRVAFILSLNGVFQDEKRITNNTSVIFITE